MREKILLHDYGAYPFILDLAIELSRDYIVYFAYNASFDSPNSRSMSSINDRDFLKILPIRISDQISKESLTKRFFQQREYGVQISNEIERFGIDIFIYANTPIDSLKHPLRLCRKKGIKKIFWMQDIYGLAVKTTLKNRFGFIGSIIGLRYELLERQIAKKSDRVIVISEDFLSHINNENRKKTEILPNWSPIPNSNINNNWFQKNGIYHKHVLLYSGTLGFKHNPDIILEIAKSQGISDELAVVVISEGPSAEYLKEKKSVMELSNLYILPFQPYNILCEIISSSDLCLSILNNVSSKYSVPSKVLTYISFGRPVILVANTDNLASRIILENNLGYVFPPGSEQELYKSIENFDEFMARLKAGIGNAQSYVKKNFDLKEITSKFKQFLNK